MALSEARGLPVRVIRGAGGDPAHSPASGYRYDGLFSVERHWSEPSNDGPLIFRYELRQLEPGGAWEVATEGQPTGGGDVPPQGNPTPGRQASVVQRIVRNSAVTQYVKQLYDYTCQFCAVRLTVGAGAYAEGAHVRPVGGKHGGADGTDNVLCLCPNDHVLFDKGAVFVDEELNLRETTSGQVRALLNLRHAIEPANFAYHREFIAGLR
ncbi:putative restriction endonuclease [Arthrobacter sp. CAN_A1]